MARRLVVMALLTGVLALSTSGCLRERICPAGEQQVRSIDYAGEGDACTEDGEVPAGFETFPPEQRPTEVYVDEQP